MITYYDITEDELSKKPFEAEALYCCTDSQNIYLDSLNEKVRKRMSSDIIVLATESNRTSILAPIPNKLYCVVSTGTMWMYTNTWNKIGGAESITYENVVVESSKSTIISDDKIKANSVAYFYPDASVADLATDITVNCANGSATISLTSNYDVFGTLVVYC